MYQYLQFHLFSIYSFLALLSLPLVQSIVSSILCGIGFIGIHDFSLFILWEVFLFPSTMPDSFPGGSHLVGVCGTIKLGVHCPRFFCPLAFPSKNQLLLWCVFLYDMWFFSGFFQYHLLILCIMSGSFLFDLVWCSVCRCVFPYFDKVPQWSWWRSGLSHWPGILFLLPCL